MDKIFDSIWQSLAIPQDYDSLLKHSANIILLAGTFILTLAVAWLAGRITRKLLIKIVKKAATKTKTQIDDIAIEKKLLHRLAHLVPITLFFLSTNFVPSFEDKIFLLYTAFIQKLALVLLIFLIALIIDSVLNTIETYYSGLDIALHKPIKSYLQVVKIIVFCLIAIFIISTLINRSPWALLTGIGALTAVLLLVFKDSILGLVASIQLASYDMIRIGDWIEMPKYGADGDVIDISLNTIKVQNWDKTITTIPTYAVLSDPVKNWRGMSESGGRRIKRHLEIDMNSIKFCDEEMLARFEKIHYISDYVQAKRQEVQQYNADKKVDKSLLVNGRHLTNLGTFRAYIEAYLKNHPKIHQGMTLLVRHLQPTQTGLPIEIYVFSNDQAWANYESIQADIFDHLLAILPEFDLRIFQSISDKTLMIQ